MSRRREGFTIVEVLIALVMLSIGVMAMASSVGSINRMMASGKRKTQSFAFASGTLDSIRMVANSTTTKCSSLSNGTSASSASPYGTAFTRTLIIANATTGSSKMVTVQTAYRVGPYLKGDTLIATVSC